MSGKAKHTYIHTNIHTYIHTTALVAQLVSIFFIKIMEGSHETQKLFLTFGRFYI